VSGVEDLKATLALVRGRLAMLESSAPPDTQDSELRKRIQETRIEEGVILAKLAEVTAARARRRRPIQEPRQGPGMPLQVQRDRRRHRRTEREWLRGCPRERQMHHPTALRHRFHRSQRRAQNCQLTRSRRRAGPASCQTDARFAAILGAPALAVSSGIMDSEMVLNPAASISRCTSPTDQQHTGQTGTSTTTSTCSSRSCRTILGRASRRSRSGRRV
jgi:hypothetical protein